MFYVYKITNKINNKIYVGKAEDVNERWLKHLSEARNNRGYILHKAINKYGKNNFIISIIEKYETDILALEAEKFWIAEYKTNICKYGNEFGYNLTDGGEGVSGHIHSDISKQKMSDSSKGKSKSDEHKKQLSLSHIGKILTKTHKLNIGISVSGKIRTLISKVKYSASKMGDKNPNAILNSERVKEIKILLSIGKLSNSEIAKLYGVAPRTIRDIKNNKTWKNI